MSTARVRGGPAEEPTQDSGGLPGSSARELSFVSYACPCYVTAIGADVTYIKLNATGATDSNYDMVIYGTGERELSADGIINIEKVSLYQAGGGDYDKVRVTGWPPG